MSLRLPHLLVLCVLIGCSGKDSDSGDAGDGWLVPLQDLGPARVGAPDVDPVGQADDLWFLSAHFLPGIDWDEPTVDVPLFLFETLAMQDTVADSGSCPYTVLDAGQTTWVSDCRSTNGYEWTGEVVRREWTEGGLDFSRWDANLTVVGDSERADFDRLALDGSVVYVRGGDGPLTTAIQANMEAQLVGLWARADADDPREAAWADWAWTGRDELTASGHRIDGSARLAGLGTVGLQASAVQVSDACGLSPTGTVTATGSSAVDLEFHGATDCRQCADLTQSDGSGGETCAR